MKLVSIIVPNWNTKHLLDDCIEAIKRQTYKEIELIVVDNGSTDDSVEHLKRNYFDLKLVANSQNLGFAKAVNIGIGKAEGDYILPLNTDVTMDKKFVEEMVEAVKEENVGFATGKLIKADSASGDKIDSAGHIVHRNRLLSNRGEGLHQSMFNKEEYVFGACGAAPLYKKKMLDDIAYEGEYFDECFFSFLEDVDLDWRAQIRGWKCKYNPRAVAYHLRGGTAVRRSTIVEKHNYKNRYFMIMKNDSFVYFLLNLPQIIFTDIVKSSALLFRAPMALTGWFSVIRYLPQMIKKRHYIQKRRKVKAKDLEKNFKKFEYKKWFKKHITEDVYNLRG